MTDGEMLACPFVDCPPGHFMYAGMLCFKSEYSSKPGQADAYCCDSGEYFWGGTNGDLAARRALIVTPVEVTRAPTDRDEGYARKARYLFLAALYDFGGKVPTSTAVPQSWVEAADRFVASLADRQPDQRGNAVPPEINNPFDYGEGYLTPKQKRYRAYSGAKFADEPTEGDFIGEFDTFRQAEQAIIKARRGAYCFIWNPVTRQLWREDIPEWIPLDVDRLQGIGTVHPTSDRVGHSNLGDGQKIASARHVQPDQRGGEVER